jgi:hypothetical protein
VGQRCSQCGRFMPGITLQFDLARQGPWLLARRCARRQDWVVSDGKYFALLTYRLGWTQLAGRQRLASSHPWYRHAGLSNPSGAQIIATILTTGKPGAAPILAQGRGADG